ncbi:MAG TPA: prepilin peptidase [Verrucomicrobia bacterium]|nr:prepilin peptidase [Verrucomicrobiota bacterium]
MFNPDVWAAVPFHFWTVMFFIFGSMVGSFLNVCIYRIPEGKSIVSPPSHCPKCNNPIPWYHNIPIFSWIGLRGKCGFCSVAISPRYLLIEFLTGILFLSIWLAYGKPAPVRIADITDSVTLVDTLNPFQDTHPAGRNLYFKLSNNTTNLLQIHYGRNLTQLGESEDMEFETPSTMLLLHLVRDLNGLVESGPLFNPDMLNDAGLSEEQKRSMLKPGEEGALKELNRHFLTQVFGTSLAPAPGPFASLGLSLILCLFIAGLIAATFIDLDHLIIPDEITLGGIGGGFICSFLVPSMHDVPTRALGLEQSFLGIAVGWGIIYAFLRFGKWAFGTQRFEFEEQTTVRFTEIALELPDQTLPFEDIFFRKTDTLQCDAVSVKLNDQVFENVSLRLSPDKLTIGKQDFNPEEITSMEVVTDRLVIPREAMGFGDVKFMAAIGAFIGWQGTLFSLMASSILGSFVGLGLILIKKRDLSGKIPYGPYIAAAAVLWLFGGRDWVRNWFFFY